MYNLINNQKGKVSFRAIVTGLMAVLVIASLGYISNTEGNSQKLAVKPGIVARFNINPPQKYTEPLIIKSLGNIFSIKPVGAASVDKIESDNTVKYEDPYPYTDIVQTITKNKIKEDIILKQRGHPEEFSYKINLDKYDFEVDSINDFVFYEKGHIGDSLYRVFTIPAPFMWDSAGRVSNNREVETNLTEDGILTLKPSKQWLANATYPVTVDPTVEINVLNIQSYPTVGGPWEVRFTTEGTEDLTITGMSHDDISTIFNTDIEFASLTCGSEERLPIFNESNNSYVYENWSCGEIAYFTSTVLLPGKHHLEFDFGGEIANAYNDTSSWYNPSAEGDDYNEWSSAENTYASDNSDATCTATAADENDVYNFGITDLGSVGSIDGIQVDVECYAFNKAINIKLSWDGGASQTAAKAQTCTLSEGYHTYGGSADTWSRSWTTTELNNTNFRVYGDCTGATEVDHIRVQITYTPGSGNETPTISSVRDYPDPISAGDDVSFSVNWNDADAGDLVKVKVCKSDALSAQNCTGGSWASSTAFATTDPKIVNYTTVSESGSQNYYVFVCDDEAACSSSTSGTFTVHTAGGISTKIESGIIKVESGILKFE